MRASVSRAYAGKINNAGIPNMTGRFISSDDNNGAIVTGVFYVSGNAPATETGGEAYSKYISMDASKASNVYGNSTTVMPASINIPAIIYLGS